MPSDCVLTVELVVIAAFCDAPLFELDGKAVVVVNGTDAKESWAEFEEEVDTEDNVEIPAVLTIDPAALDVCVLDTVAIALDVTICGTFSAEVELPMKSACEEVA